MKKTKNKRTYFNRWCWVQTTDILGLVLSLRLCMIHLIYIIVITTITVIVIIVVTVFQTVEENFVQQPLRVCSFVLWLCVCVTVCGCSWNTYRCQWHIWNRYRRLRRHLRTCCRRRRWYNCVRCSCGYNGYFVSVVFGVYQCSRNTGRRKGCGGRWRWCWYV